ncbi:LacI family DNA-binding transcriptional regulator [Spirillospora sp. NBC_00431]
MTPSVPRQQDIARRAGVSQAAVSRTFGGGPVAKETREKVLRAAAEFGYSPDAIARSLVTGQSTMIAVVLGDIHNPFYPYVLDRLTTKFNEAGRQVLLFTVPPGRRVDDVLPQALAYRVAGVVVASAELSSNVAVACAERNTPLVLFNRYVPGSGAAGVSCDNREGGRLAAEHLFSRGRRNFAFVGGLAGTSTNVDRRDGFVEAVRRGGGTVGDVLEGAYSYEWGYQAADRVGAGAADAVLCGNDIIAMGLLDGLRHGSSRTVPDDVAVVGFDDIPAAAWPAYSLTTVRQPVDQMIDATVALLAGEPGTSPGEGRAHRFPAELVVRGSTTSGR